MLDTRMTKIRNLTDYYELCLNLAQQTSIFANN